MPRSTVVFLLAGSLAAAPAVAIDKGSTTPIGTAITYQGELRSSGRPAAGVQDFEACLFSVPTPNATPPLVCVAADDQPIDAAGRFTLTLDFGASFNGTARYLEMRVRPGASGGAYTALLPRQAIRPTPEALRAASAPWSGIAGAPAGFGDGVDDTGITSLAAGNGLTTNPAAPGSGAPIGTTGTLSVRPAGITASMMAPGAIGLAQIDPSQVQARIAASCAPGDALVGIGSDGSAQCVAIATRIDRLLDYSGDVGSEIALALRGVDIPLVAYYYATSGNLKLHSCNDRSCSTGTTRTLDVSGDVGRGPAIAVGADGNALIAYQDVTNLALKLYVCADAACSTGSSRTVDDTRDVTRSIALLIRADGRPLIAYGNATDFDLRVFDCSDAACGGGSSRSVTGSMFAGSALSMALSPSGLPVILKGGNGGAGQPIVLVRCADAGCTSPTATRLDNEYGSAAALVMRSNDRPLVAGNSPGTGIYVYDCSTTTCSSFTERVIDAELTSGVDMALDGTDPVLTFRQNVAAGEGRLRIHRCRTNTCIDGATRSVVSEPGESFGFAARIVVRSDGRPVVAHQDGNRDDLLLHVCANPECI